MRRVEVMGRSSRDSFDRWEVVPGILLLHQLFGMLPGTMSATTLLTEYQMIVAYFSALLVQIYAVHAQHSGIPEIKTVLGGFIIRRFLGAWTLITKSFGLVCS